MALTAVVRNSDMTNRIRTTDVASSGKSCHGKYSRREHSAGLSVPGRSARSRHSEGLMRNRFDHLGKQIGKKALGPFGPTVAHDEISPETQQADLRHEPDPIRKAQRARLGL